MRHIFEKESRIAASAERVFAWHERPEALEELIPPGEPIRVVEHKGGIQDGARVVLSMGYGPFAMQWVAIHQNYIAGQQFEDVQAKGPMKYWKHTHLFLPEGEGACVLRDHVEYELPFAPLSEVAAGAVRRKLMETFEYRHRVTKAAFGAKTEGRNGEPHDAPLPTVRCPDGQPSAHGGGSAGSGPALSTAASTPPVPSE